MRRGYSHQPHQQQDVSFGNLSYTENIPEYIGLPMDDIVRASTDMYQRGTENRLMFDELLMSAEKDLQNIRSEHVEDKNIIINNINKIGETLNKFIEGGNFHNAGIALSKTLREYVSDPSRVAAVTARQRQLEHAEKVKALGLPSSYERKALEISNNAAFNKPITVDENGEVTGGYTGFTPAAYVDHNTLIKTFFDNWGTYKDGYSAMPSEDSPSLGMWDIDKAGLKPYLEKYDLSSKGLSEDKVVAALSNFLSNHDEYKDWMESKYVMDHYDPQTGDISTPDPISYAARLVSRKYNSDKTPRSNEELVTEGLTILEGRVAKIRDRYFDSVKEPLDYATALDMAHKEFYMEDERMGHISGLGGKYIHEVREFNHSIKQDDLYHGRAKAATDLLFNVHKYSGEPADIRLSSLTDKIEESESLIANYEISIENLNRQLGTAATDTDRERIQDEINYLEELHNLASANKNLMSGVLDNILSTATEDQKYQAGQRAVRNFVGNAAIPFAGGKYLSRRERDELFGIVLEEGGLEKAYTHLVNRFKGTLKQDALGASTKAISEEEAKELAKDFVDTYQRAYIKELGEEALNYHTNKFVIIPSGGNMARMQSSLEEGLKYRRDSFVSIDGRVSSTDKDIQKVMDESDDVKVTFLSDTHGSNLEVLVAYYKGGKLLKSYIAQSSMLDGISTDFANEIIAGSENPAYAHNPSYAAQLREMGQGLYVSLQTVNIAGANMTMRDAIKSLNMEAWSHNIGNNSNSEPIIFSHGGKDLKLTFSKTHRGYTVQYENAEGVKEHIRSEHTFYASPETAFIDIYEWMSKPNVQLEDYE